MAFQPLGRRLTGGAACGAGTDGSSPLTVDTKQSVYLVHSRRTDTFLTTGRRSYGRWKPSAVRIRLLSCRLSAPCEKMLE